MNTAYPVLNMTARVCNIFNCNLFKYIRVRYNERMLQRTVFINKIGCYNEQGCYKERGGILSADVARACT